MRRHVAWQLLLERPGTDRLQGRRVQLDRSMPFFQCQQLVPVPHDVSVRDTVRWQTGDARIGIGSYARGAEQRPTGGAFKSPLPGSHPSVAIGDVAIVDIKCVHHPVSVERVVVPARRKLWIRSDTIEGPVEVFWDFALDGQMRVVAFQPNRLEAVGQIWIDGKRARHARTSSVLSHQGTKVANRQDEPLSTQISKI